MDIASFLIYCIIVTFTPGPTNIVILSVVNNYGGKKAMRFVGGAIAAFSILLAISAALNSILVALMPKILNIMQIIGSLYILYLAFQIYRMDTSKGDKKQISSFMSGFIMQFVNPKVILFTMTVIPSFVMPYYTSPFMLSTFVLVIMVTGLIAMITWVLFGTVFKRFLHKYQKAVNIVMALFLVYSAVMVSGAVEFLKGD